MQNTVRNASFYSILDRMMLAVGKLLMVLLVARLLGPEGQGVYAFALAVWAMSSTLTSIGMEVANNYYGARQQGALTSTLFGNSLMFGLVLGPLGGALLFGLAQTPLFPPEFMPYATLLSVGIPLTLITSLLSGLLMGSFGFSEKFLADTLLYLGCAATIISSALSNSLGTQNLLLYWVLWQALSTLLIAVALLHKSNFRISFDLSMFKEQRRYAMQAYAFKLAFVVNSRFDTIVIAYLLGPAALGLYSAAVAATEVILYMPAALTNVLLSAVSSGRTISTRIYHTVLTLLILAGAACVIVAFVLFPYVLGPEFSASAPLAAILVFGTVALGMGDLASYHLFGFGKTALPTGAASASAVCVVIGDVVLIPYLGLFGAALASAFAYSLFGLLTLHFLARYTGAKITDFLRPNPFSLCKSLGKSLLRVGGYFRRWRYGRS